MFARDMAPSREDIRQVYLDVYGIDLDQLRAAREAGDLSLLTEFRRRLTDEHRRQRLARALGTAYVNRTQFRDYGAARPRAGRLKYPMMREDPVYIAKTVNRLGIFDDCRYSLADIKGIRGSLERNRHLLVVEQVEALKKWLDQQI